MNGELVRGAYPALSDDERERVACAWSDYRRDYGVPADTMERARMHLAFVHAWQACLSEERAG